MRSCALAAAAALLLLAAGCAGQRQQRIWADVLDAEKRALEDRLFDLEHEYEILTDQLAACRRENDALKQELNGGPRTIAPRAPTRGAPPGGRGGPPVDVDDLAPPEIELPAPSGRPDVLPAPARPAATGATATGSTAGGEFPTDRLNPAARSTVGRLLAPRPSPMPEDDYVTHIFLNPLLTGGEDRDNRPGDEGVSVVIEPRNGAGQYVPLAGAVSVVLLDPALQGAEARVARWDFDITETQPLLKDTAMGRGLHLSLPWPNQPPHNTRLHLFVRYTTADQRKIEADRQIFIDLPGQASNRWTPRSTAPRTADERAAPDTNVPPPMVVKPAGADSLGDSPYRPSVAATDDSAAALDPNTPRQLVPEQVLEARRIPRPRPTESAQADAGTGEASAAVRPAPPRPVWTPSR